MSNKKEFNSQLAKELSYINEFSRLCVMISSVVIVYETDKYSFEKLYNKLKNSGNSLIEHYQRELIFNDKRVIELFERYKEIWN